jgi:cysteinyl-tRNA synthetase
MEMYDTHIDRWFRGDLNREDVSEIEKLMAERNEARAHKDWELADRIKNRLVFMGVQILDYPEGSHWRRVGRFHIN